MERGLRSRTPLSLAVIAAIVTIAGCAAPASKRILSQWRNPNYASTAPSFQRIMVAGVTDDSALRRNFEDELSAQLQTSGIDAAPSYRYFPENGKVAESRFNESVRKAGADALIITRILRVEQRTTFIPGNYDAYPAFGPYGWYSSAWQRRFYAPAQVYRYPVFISETTLYDLTREEIVWTGTIRTVDPESIDAAIKEYL